MDSFIKKSKKETISDLLDEIENQLIDVLERAKSSSIKVKQGLRLCSNTECKFCPYYGNNCSHKLIMDAFTLIERLEDQLGRRNIG